MRRGGKKVGWILIGVLLLTCACGSRTELPSAGNQVEENRMEELQEDENPIKETKREETQTEENIPEENIPEEPEIVPEEPSEPLPAPEPPVEEIRLMMVGDMLMHERVMESGLQEDGTYNYDHLFTHVKDQIAEADLALVNQETILGGVELGLTGYPTFNSPYELGIAEVEAGFDVILFGTNHALDKGKKGVINCMDFWETNYPEITWLGINRSQEAQEEFLYVYEQDGIRIAILNYTYGTNGIKPPEDMPFLVNYLEEGKVREDLARAEEMADFTVVCPHWGIEYVLEPSGQQKNWTQIFLEGGADLILGTHPHVIEPVEWVSDEEGNEMLVYYSLGNFVNGTAGTGAGVMNRMVGGLADVTVGRDDEGQVVIKEYDVIPLVCHIGRGDEYTVWYLEDYTEELAAENHICSQDPSFSLANCQALVEQVWGNYKE